MNMGVQTSFDLRDSPWILVRDDDGVREVSIRECFATAHQLRDLAGEIPTQRIAVLRFLLVILARSVAADDRSAIDIWGDLWSAEQLPTEAVDSYLDCWADRFDLLHPKTPFYQVADLSASKTSGLVKLVGDAPDGAPYFTTRAGLGLESLSLAEATRWLIHCQAFDPSGIKSGAHGDPRVKQGKGYPIGTGWAGQLGLVTLDGADLKQTLLLNLVIDPEDPDATPDVPVWERPPLTAGVESGHPEPVGTNDLMTWSSRRVRLFVEQDRVTDVLICNGDAIHGRNRQQLEPMTAWRRSPYQEKAHHLPLVYLPRQHDPARSLWRGLGGLLGSSGESGAVDNQAPNSLPPALIEWLSSLQHAGILAPDYPVLLRATGMQYGSNNSVVEAVVDDSLRMRLALLTDASLIALATQAVDAAEKGVDLLVDLNADLAKARDIDPAGARARARESGYHQLDMPYREWLSTLTSSTDRARARTDWESIVVRLISATGRELVEHAGVAAWIGKRDNRKKRHITSSLAEVWFSAELKKAFPDTWQQVPGHNDQQKGTGV